MNSKSLRRLAADHSSLHTAGLPPNYLFPPTSSDSDSLTTLDVLLAGPLGTPYASGVWHLRLDIPPTYPAAPPTAAFRTRLWHPNIDEATGAVCVETLKRDWKSELRLRDVLVTISCLLIQPNPASALNEAAGKLAQEDWDGYCRRARLMTSIHAGVPANLVEGVREAQSRGEDVKGKGEREREEVADKIEGKGKGKERVKITPVMASKTQRLPAEDDAENTQQQEPTDPGSGESDWIPGPAATRRTNNNNIFGIKGLPLSSPPKRIFPATTNPTSTEEKQNTDPFTTVPSKHKPLSFDLRIPTSSQSSQQQQQQQQHQSATDTPELLKFSHQNPFSAIQPNNQTHALFKEFSYSWEESRILHDADVDVDADVNGNGNGNGNVNVDAGGLKKYELRKRLAGEEFEEKRRWEMKRFKRAGGELGRWNKGDFGPRVGIGRL